MQQEQQTTILDIYDRFMHLKIFVDIPEIPIYQVLKEKYISEALKHNEKIKASPQFIDAGFDLYLPYRNVLDSYSHQYNIKDGITCFYGPGWEQSPTNKVDYKIICSATMHTDTGKVYPTGYTIHPRSSLSKTHLRLANSTGIIDAGYRGHIMAMFDVVNIDKDDDTVDKTKYTDEYGDALCDCIGEPMDRYVQICAPGLVPIFIEVVNTLEELGEKTERGTGGFGSTGV